MFLYACLFKFVVLSELLIQVMKMKRSKYRDDEKRNSLRSPTPKSLKRIGKSVILTALPYIVVLIVGVTTLIILFPELARWFPSLSFFANMRFFSSISTFFTNL